MSTDTSFIPSYATVLARKMAEAQKGGYCLSPENKSDIANEVGVMSKDTYMAMWEAIPVTSVDRQRLMGIVCSSCAPDTAAIIVQDWMMEEATRIAVERLERQDAARIAASERMLADAARTANEAADEFRAAREERAEARELLELARNARNAAADQAEIAFLRSQLQDANARLDAITVALHR